MGVRMHQRKLDDHAVIKDLAEYADNPPFPASEGFEWVQGEPVENHTLYAQKSTAELLRAKFDALDINLRAQFAPLKAAVHLELQQDNVDVAKAIIQTATIPAELESLRAELLAEFPE